MNSTSNWTNLTSFYCILLFCSTLLMRKSCTASAATWIFRTFIRFFFFIFYFLDRGPINFRVAISRDPALGILPLPTFNTAKSVHVPYIAIIYPRFIRYIQSLIVDYWSDLIHQLKIVVFIVKSLRNSLKSGSKSSLFNLIWLSLILAFSISMN